VRHMRLLNRERGSHILGPDMPSLWSRKQVSYRTDRPTGAWSQRTREQPMYESIAKQFRQPSGFWGMIASAIMKKRNVIAYDKLIRELDIRHNDAVMEIGYGHGVGIDRICSSCDCSVTGIDFSSLMFNEARKRNKRHIEREKVTLHCGDFLTCDLGVAKYDKIFCINVVYFWKNLNEPFVKIRGVLKSSGIFCIYMAHQDELNKNKFAQNDIFNKHSIEHVVDELKHAGFSDIRHRFDVGYLISGRS
jgi:cyclopropane fatty-acyl-phospholipid synthase-like methyltransferase